MSQRSFSQFRAMMAIAKASFKAYLKSPSGMIFSLLFPIIFILMFGTMRGGGGMKLSVYVENQATDTFLLEQLRHVPVLKWDESGTRAEAEQALKKNDIDAMLSIRNAPPNPHGNRYQIAIVSSSIALANGQLEMLKHLLMQFGNEEDAHLYPENKKSVELLPATIVEARKFKPIDFILPGQLGFSLISTGIFGVAFSFFFFRKTGVLKRMFATPIRKAYILLGEGLARISFQMLAALIIIGFGYLFFDFVLLHGWWTLLQMLVVCFLGLAVFMNIGFLISNLCHQEQAIPGIANLVTIPQFLLSGAFFSTSFFPKWLQDIAQVLPLTHVNNALRKISFEGKSLWEVKLEIGILLGFGLIFYVLNVKNLRWS